MHEKYTFVYRDSYILIINIKLIKMIYLITDGIYTKIGKTKLPLKRIQVLQTSNANNLLFQYIFDTKDCFEKKLHELLKDYKTKSNNEWFDLRNINIEDYFKLINCNKFQDIGWAKFKAKQINNEFYRGNIYTSENRKEIIDKLYRNKKKKQRNLKDKRSDLIQDIKDHLENNKNKAISYDKYVIKYGFTKAEISYFMKSCKLSNLIKKHNDIVFS